MLPKRKLGDILEVEFDEIGSGRFVAVGTGKQVTNHDSVSIILTCDVSERMLALREYWKQQDAAASSIVIRGDGFEDHHDSSSASGKKSSTTTIRSPHKMLKNRRSGVAHCAFEDEEFRMPAPVPFSLFLENHNNNNNSSSQVSDSERKGSKRSLLSLPMCVTASCLADFTLSIDSVSFVNHTSSVRELLERSPDALISRRNFYQGPRLHQGHLAEYALGTNFSVSPIALPRQHRALPLKLSSKYNPCPAGASSRYGHHPVHTVPPRVYDSLFRWFGALGIDDTFAADVRSIAMEVVDLEYSNWRATVVDETRRKIHK